MSFRNILMVGGLILAGLAVLMGVADRREGGLLPGSAKAPSGGGYVSSTFERAPGAARPIDDGVRRAQIRSVPQAEPDALRADLPDRLVTGALDALRAARAAGDRVFGRDRAEAGAEVGAKAGAAPQGTTPAPD